MFPSGTCVVGVGCGSGVDLDGDGDSDSIQDYLCQYYPCNSIDARTLERYDDAVIGLLVENACRALSRTIAEYAPRAARKMLAGKKPNKSGKDCEFACDTVTVTVECDTDMKEIVNNRTYRGRPIPNATSCRRNLCEHSKVFRRR